MPIINITTFGVNSDTHAQSPFDIKLCRAISRDVVGKNCARENPEW